MFPIAHASKDNAIKGLIGAEFCNIRAIKRVRGGEGLVRPPGFASFLYFPCLCLLWLRPRRRSHRM
jgi:hypothetical protein